MPKLVLEEFGTWLCVCWRGLVHSVRSPQCTAHSAEVASGGIRDLVEFALEGPGPQHYESSTMPSSLGGVWDVVVPAMEVCGAQDGESSPV